MARRPSLPRELDQEILARSNSGQTLRAIKEWLATLGHETTEMTVMRTLDRIRGIDRKKMDPVPPRVEDPVPEEPPEPVAVKGAEPLDTMKFWRRKSHVEARAAHRAMEEGAEDGWKRYHSAIRLVAAMDAAAIRREEFEERPRPSAPQTVATPAQAAEMTQEERDAWVAAAEGPPN